MSITPISGSTLPLSLASDLKKDSLDMNPVNLPGASSASEAFKENVSKQPLAVQPNALRASLIKSQPSNLPKGEFHLPPLNLGVLADASTIVRQSQPPSRRLSVLCVMATQKA